MDHIFLPTIYLDLPFLNLGLLLLSVISFFYQQFRDNVIVNMAMASMLAGVAAVICDVVINMAKSIFLQKRVVSILVLVGSFVAVRFFNVNIMIVILLCGIIGALETWRREKLQKEESGK